MAATLDIVTKRVDTDEGDWKGWNWRSEGDVMVNGAFFVASGEGVEFKYEKAYSVEPKSAVLIDQLTMHSGVLGVGGRDNNLGKWSSGVNGDGSDFGSGEDEDDDYSDDMSGSNIPGPSLKSLGFTSNLLYQLSKKKKMAGLLIYLNSPINFLN
ncbi:hypothetical protein GOBAR_DD34567 [Gossypium barbadense]|nr:hypothetical protein GOBAR_DD34567 [Gossypium barbadense]